MTPQEQKIMEQALEALETYHGYMEPLLTVFGGPRVPAEKSTTYKVEKAITAIKEAFAQPEQERNLKLMPREATREMLEAMDECSMEGYDERLYAGHAGSVYMAAWDAFHGQHCYCGDITNLGVIHRDDGPCHYPDHTNEYKRGYADAMNWKVQNHLEHLQPKEPEQEPVAFGIKGGLAHETKVKND